METQLREVNDVYRRAFERAQQMPEGAKMIEGLRMFDHACRIMSDGIRRRKPYITDQEVLEEVRRFVRIADRLENMGWMVLDDLAHAHETP